MFIFGLPLFECRVYWTNLAVVCDSTYDLNLLLQQSKLGEQYSLSNQQPKMSDSYSQEQSAAFLSRYAQEATEVIKNAVGVCKLMFNCIYVY